MSEIILTDAAALQIAKIMQELGNTKVNMRTFIEAGGCSGFRYGFKLDEKIDPSDTVIEKAVDCDEIKTVKLVIDNKSLTFLENAVIDYKSSLQGAQFIINNPAAAATCSCGISFSTD